MGWPLVAAVIGSAFISGKSSKSAAGIQSESSLEAARLGLQGTREGIASQERMLEQALALDKPFRDIALKNLRTLETLANVDLESGLSPLGLIEQREGEKSISRALRARGISKGGVEGDLLSRFNANLFARESENRFNRLRTVAGLAPTGTGSNQIINTGGNIASLQQRGGELAGAGVLGAGSARSRYQSGLGALPFDAINLYSRFNTNSGGGEGSGTGSGASSAFDYDTYSDEVYNA